MALNLSHLRAIQNSLESPTPTETIRREAILTVGKDFYKSLDVDMFMLFDKQLTDIELYLNTYDRKYSHYNGVEQKFTTLLDANIEAGDLVYCKKQDEYWIVITSAPIDYIYRQGLMFLCDTTIKWEDSKGNIWEYPVSDINATQYNSGVFQGKMIDYVTSQHKLITTADDNIRALKIDTRFFLGSISSSAPDVYRLTQLDVTSLGYGKSIATLTLLRAVYDPETDNIESGICKTKKDVNEIPASHSNNILYEGKPTIYIGGTKQIKSQIPNCTWSINEDDIAKEIQIVPCDSNTIELVLSLTDVSLLLENKTFTLVCTDSFGNVETQVFKILGGV